VFLKSGGLTVEAVDLRRRAEQLLPHVSHLNEHLYTKGYVRLPGFVDRDELRIMSEAWQRASCSAKRRDLTITYANLTSTRRLYTLGADDVFRYSNLPDQIYYDASLLSLFSAISGISVVPLEDPVEKYVINALLTEGDHHGVHLDSFPFACSVPIVQPPHHRGGCLQIAAPDSPDELHDVQLAAGDLVFFFSGTLVHRVTSISSGTRRVVLNMAYATPETSSVESSSRELLYD
jgi:hypothetical protein